jgi:hypothetical protein
MRLKGKMMRTAILKLSDTETRELGKLVHRDLCGLMRTRSIQPNLYIVSYRDDKIGWIHLGFLSEKSQQLKEFKAYQMTFEHRRGIKIKGLRTDGVNEYTNRESQDYLKEHGIRSERSSPQTPQQNGQAERLNKTIIEMARCLMITVGLGHEYWQYAATIANFIRNRTPTILNKGTMLSFEAMWGHKPNLHNLPLFGCKSQVHVLDTLRRKLNPKMKDCIFLGYAEGLKASVFERVAPGQRFAS